MVLNVVWVNVPCAPDAVGVFYKRQLVNLVVHILNILTDIFCLLVLSIMLKSLDYKYFSI